MGSVYSPVEELTRREIFEGAGEAGNEEVRETATGVLGLDKLAGEF